MRKLIAISFLTIILFNIVGYKLVIWGMGQYGHQQFISKVDKVEYNEEDLVSIKTILHLPYYTGSPQFERAYGTINIDGVEHEYVKRKVYKDTLELLCLPNYQMQKLKKAGDDIAKTNTEAENIPQSKKSGSLKINFPDYCSDVYSFEGHLIVTSQNQFHIFQDSQSLHGFVYGNDKPPQVILL